MTSRKSSGSSRAESSVELTRSQNITVSCRRSASAAAGGSRGAAITVAAGGGGPAARAAGGGVRARRGQADADQVVGRQRGQSLAIDIIVAECRRVSFEPLPAQPRHYVHAVTLGSEERQPLTKEDIPLPFGLPAVALK